MVRYRWFVALVPGTLGLVLCCGPSLPSTTPLGGNDEFRASDAPASSPEAPAASASPSPHEAEDEEADQDDGEGSDDEGGEEMPATVAKGETKAPEQECKPSSAKPPDCEAMETGPCADDFGELCHLMASWLEPEVATAAVDCLTKKNRHSRCDEVAQCLQPALEKSCVEEGDREWCRQFLKRCPKLEGFELYQNQQNCERARGAATDEAKQKIDACLADSCGLMDCAEGLDLDDEDED